MLKHSKQDESLARHAELKRQSIQMLKGQPAFDCRSPDFTENNHLINEFYFLQKIIEQIDPDIYRIVIISVTETVS